MRFKLVGITNDCFESKREIMKSTDVNVLESIKDMLVHFQEYKKLEIVKA